MMTKLKSRGHTKLKLLILLPVVALLFLMFSCINGNNKTETVTAVELSKMNVLYLGVGNPVTIAASGIDASELQVEIDNGTIEGSNGEYIIAPKEFKNATVKVSNKGKLIKELMFRVKTVPDPVPAVQIRGHSYIKGGEITKDELLNAEGVIVVLENFDFDLKFDIQEFSISKGDSNSPEISQTGKFSDTQKAIIRNTKKGGKIAFEDIKATGPDGRTRILSPMIFTIKE